MRTTVFVIVLAVWAYSVYCALVVMFDRSGGATRWFIPVWAGEGLSPRGLKYRRNHLLSIVLGCLLGLLYFNWPNG
jgi:hypothetical protein